MVIFNSYVKLPEGKINIHPSSVAKPCWISLELDGLNTIQNLLFWGWGGAVPIVAVRPIFVGISLFWWVTFSIL